MFYKTPRLNSTKRRTDEEYNRVQSAPLTLHRPCQQLNYQIHAEEHCINNFLRYCKKLDRPNCFARKYINNNINLTEYNMIVIRFVTIKHEAFDGGAFDVTEPNVAPSSTRNVSSDEVAHRRHNASGALRRRAEGAWRSHCNNETAIPAAICCELKCSKPCFDCIQLLKKHGIKKIYYSTENATLIGEKINAIQNRSSSGRKIN